MTYSVLITHEAEPNVFVAEIPLLEIVTQADTFAGAVQAAQEAIALELDVRRADGLAVPVEPPDYATLVQVSSTAADLEPQLSVRMR